MSILLDKTHKIFSRMYDKVGAQNGIVLSSYFIPKHSLRGN